MKIFSVFIAVSMIALSSYQSLAASATAEQIKVAVSGNTVQGSMDSSGPYAEYYAPDGTVFGKDYKAKWSVEGDQMCWVYDATPKDCWEVEIIGDQIKWVKDGKSQGIGTVLKGNTNNFQ